jgi:hypothetical protein
MSITGHEKYRKKYQREQHLIVADLFAVQNHSKVEKRICKKVVIFKIPKTKVHTNTQPKPKFPAIFRFSIWIPV